MPEQNHDHDHKHEHPGPTAYMRNLREPMPFREKLKLLASNTWFKMRRRKSCCDHPGQPGC